MKLRHIALSVKDVAQAQKFFEEAFGMTKGRVCAEWRLHDG